MEESYFTRHSLVERIAALISKDRYLKYKVYWVER